MIRSLLIATAVTLFVWAAMFLAACFVRLSPDMKPWPYPSVGLSVFLVTFLLVFCFFRK